MKQALYILQILIFMLFMTSCNQEEYLFKKIEPHQSNITFSNTLNPDSQLNIFNYLYYYNGAGIACGDYNNDGLLDLYFTANEAADQLYLNQGGLKFREVTLQSKINNVSGWTTGVSQVDINADGKLDLYIAKVSNYLDLKGHNLLYINQGNDAQGNPTFKEESQKYGIDFSGFSTQSVFFDYDLDGDLDLFLLNHSTHPNRNYGSGKKRSGIDSKSGDRLYENIEGRFKDVSQKAGIFQGKIGYGLAVSVGDINNDGYPDLYVGNDFFENDYLYINQKDKTFIEQISSAKNPLGHTSHFSMGNTMADINNDGLVDILSVDMLPEDLKTYKTSGLEFPYQTYSNYLKNDFSPQYMQNTLHLNQGSLHFSEIAYLSGMAASEWSWGVLAGDYDNDGHKDLFITNGIKGATNDMDFINYIANEEIQKKIYEGEKEAYQNLIKKLPIKKEANYLFKNTGKLQFKNMQNQWLKSRPSFSQGAIQADLDNDGDLDLVTNNTDDYAGVFENTLTQKKSNYIKIRFKGSGLNTLGIGTKVYLYQNSTLQYQENHTTKSYLSAQPPEIHFGLGKKSIIDSIKIIWLNGKSQTLYAIKANQLLQVDVQNAQPHTFKNKSPNTFQPVDSLLQHTHIDQETLDFNRDPLIPFAYSNTAPKITIADYNNDHLQDLVIGGGKTQPLHAWEQSQDSLIPLDTNAFDPEKINEDTDQVFIDLNQDHLKDLVVVSGGNEFTHGEPLRPRVYINDKGVFSRDTSYFKNTYINASSIEAVDINQDGLTDISITSDVKPGYYGQNTTQYLFKNLGDGRLKDVTKQFSEAFKNFSSVKSIVWKDLNNDSYPDAIVAGHWEPITIFYNTGNKLIKQENNGLDQSYGWWNDVYVADFDKDGDQDMVAGNWGLNTRLKASVEKPVQLYLRDFDQNGKQDPIITYYYKDLETVFASRDELISQLPSLKKKFPTYDAFAKANLTELFSEKELKKAQIKHVNELASCYFENLGNNVFKKHLLPTSAQLASAHAIEAHDFNKDGYLDLIMGGNDYEISTQLGRLDASHGTILINTTTNFKNSQDYKIYLNGPVRDIQKIILNKTMYFIVTTNNGKTQLFKSTL